jgi:hypothetical protein
MFSAYDLKKILPRAVFALVAINLSYPLMNIVITLINFFGDSIESLILGLFNTQGANFTTVQIDGNTGGWFVALTAVAAGGAILGLIPILGLAVAGMTGVLIAFAIVLIRRVALTALVLVAPIAIALMVLPQTEKWAKNWWEWFFKLLLMYPFIMGMFAISKVTAGLFSVTGAGGVTGIIYDFAAIAIIIAPYFLIGKALSFAGGTIGKLAGVVNNRDKGLIDKTKKWEGGKVADKRNSFFAGTRMNGNGAISRSINRTGLALKRPKTLISPTPEGRASAAVSSILAGAANLENVKPEVKTIAGKDELALAATGSEAAANNRIQALVAEAVRRGGGANTVSGREAGAAARRRLEAARDRVKAKAGGFDATLAMHVMERAVAEGAVTGAQAEENITGIVQRMGNNPVVQAQTREALTSTINNAVGKSDPLAGALSRQGLEMNTTRATSTNVPQFDDIINGMFEGEGALSFEDLGKLSQNAHSQIQESKVAQVEDHIASLAAAPDADTARAHINQLVQHRADLRVAHAAAVKAGDTGATSAALETLRRIDERVQAAEAAGTGITLNYVQQQSQKIVEERLKPI